MPKDLCQLLEGKWDAGNKPKELFVKFVSPDPENYVDMLVEGLKSGNRRIENGCAEMSSLLSEERPDLMYKFLPVFTENLLSPEAVLRWEAACTIGNLTAVDKGNKISKSIPALTSFLRDKSIVLQGHAVKALAKIASRNQNEAPAILNALLAAKKYFPDNRVGYLVDAMESFIGPNKTKDKIQDFIVPLVDHPINSVMKKALRIQKMLSKN